MKALPWNDVRYGRKLSAAKSEKREKNHKLRINFESLTEWLNKLADSVDSRGTQSTSRFLSRLSARCPPAQSPIVNLRACKIKSEKKQILERQNRISQMRCKRCWLRFGWRHTCLGVCLQICAYSRWYSFILVAGSLRAFAFKRSESSATGNQVFPHFMCSSSVSYTNLYWSCECNSN